MQAFLFMWLCMVPMLLGIALAKKELMICDDEPADGSGDGELICMACEVDLNALLELKGEIVRLHDQMLSIRQSAASGSVQGEQQGKNTENFLGLQDDVQNLRDYVHHWMSLQKQQQSDGGGGAAEGGGPAAGRHQDHQQQHTIFLLLRMLESFRCTLLLTGFAVGFVMSIAMLQLLQK